MIILLEMFIRFFFVGLFAVGGGLATLPFLIDMGEATGWFTQADVANMVAISESTPGPLGVNMSTYVGYQVGSQLGTAGGFLGAAIASIGLVLPSLIIIMIVSRVLMKFRESRLVTFAFYGLRAASLGLVASACLGVAKIAFFSDEIFAQTGEIFQAVNYKTVILFAVIFLCVRRFKKLHPILLIVLAAVAGILLKL